MATASHLRQRKSAVDPSMLAHLCAVAAGRSVLLAIQDPALVALRLRCSTDTVDRMTTTDSPQVWTYPRLLALVALERDALASATIAKSMGEARSLPLAALDIDDAANVALAATAALTHQLVDDLLPDGHLDDLPLARRILVRTEAAIDRLRTAIEAKATA